MSFLVDSEKEQTEAFEKLKASQSNRGQTTDVSDFMPPDISDLPQNQSEVNPSTQNTVTSKGSLSPLNRLKSLSATTRIDEMKKDLKNETYIFDGLALAGQITLFFAWPNTGKTLLFIHFLIESIRRESVKPENIFYINADDDFRGLVAKSEIAKEHGFQMISPDESGLSSQEIIDMLLALADSGEAAGVVIILDTAKKFVNLMSKSEQSSFYSALRKLSVKRVTVILAGHANKYPNIEGELVYEGTADTLNDVDCAYSINRMAPLDSDEMTIEFRNIKNRGDVQKTASFSYNNRGEASWPDRLQSVKPLDAKAAGTARFEKIKQDKIDKYDSQRLYVSALLKIGSLNQSSILKKHTEHRQDSDSLLHPLAFEISVRELQAGLDKLTDVVWWVKRDFNNNAKIYSLIDCDGSIYQQTKDGIN